TRRVALFLLLKGLLATGQWWHNNYDEPLSFKCPAGQSVSSIKSQNSNYYEDRLSAECFLSPYINEFDKAFSFQCPAQYVIAGMSSYHSNHHEDRREVHFWGQWKLSVVFIRELFEEDFQWTVPPHNVLVGVECYHQDFQEDRRWKYKYCVQQCL
uniref:Uncharacterized protein n=1 Tax=Sinocyclocheilus anshuiensis TaxID=1608454 RepID=A0A671SXL6_9TELE